MIRIDGCSLNLEEFISVTRGGEQVSLTESAVEAINKSRKLVDDIVEEKRVVYGISTGFGKFSDVSISKDETAQLQKNLIISHSCGVGNPFSEDVSRGIMLLRANALSKGNSGVRLSTIQTLIDMLNKGVTPVIPEKGSLGASGDLAPLSHMVLVMLGEGEAWYQGERLTGAEAMKRAGVPTIELTSKEGLGLINGTQVMTSVGAHAVYDGLQLSALADIAAAMTVEALNGITDAYDDRLHQLRPHQGQINTAKNMLTILEGSARTTRQGEIRVQDAYVLRCVPQVHGASKDALNYVSNKVAIELNAVTDNPIIFPDAGDAISGGNFHGQPMALPFDFLGIALSELANISERRIERLVNPALSGLPAFLTERGGLHSGFMIMQYSAASLVSENKVLAHPASVDSIPSSANQEDHVSMGTIAARKARDILQNAQNVIAIELLAACQGIDLSEQKALSPAAQKVYETIRNVVPKLEEDRIMYRDINAIVALIKGGEVLSAAEGVCGTLNK